MKRIVLLVFFGAFAICGWAQEKPAGKPKAAAEKAQPAAEKAQPAAKKPAGEKVASGRKSRRNEDARACLEKSSNTEIIKCAEEYL